QVGARVEQQTAPRIAKLGRRVVAVSGNHDSTSYMRALTRAGATVLDDESAIVDRLRVSGYSDPLESKSVDDGSHVLSVRGAAYTKQVDDFIAWFDALDTWPDVVLVHQHGFALRLARELVRRHNTRPLTLLVGHDHVPKVERVGRAILVDGGTLGAGGPFAIGSQSASFAKLNFRGNTLVSVDIVSVDPLTGDASAKRTVVGEVGRRTRHAG
ncbi:MAG: hypothetical protein JWN41_1187, partial [Thermoleophilia bacterium]|nr:hypothetical protein [Thermoleophilia bacterium]